MSPAPDDLFMGPAYVGDTLLWVGIVCAAVVLIGAVLLVTRLVRSPVRRKSQNRRRNKQMQDHRRAGPQEGHEQPSIEHIRKHLG